MLEPTSLTRSAIHRLPRQELITWANAHCLLEHLSDHEVTAMTKTQVVDEVMGALLRAEMYEDHRAFAQDDVARPLDELI
jgi:hypothetical protein